MFVFVLIDFLLVYMNRGGIEFLVTEDGITAARWLYTKEVLLMSNCHSSTIGTTNRIFKNGDEAEISCPDAIIFDNTYMSCRFLDNLSTNDA